MPSPVAGDVHVNTPLSNLSVAYAQNTNDFIADKIFPTIPVMKQSDLYWVFDRDAWYRTDARERAPGTESVGVGWKVSTTPYFAPVYAVHNDIDDQTRSNADPAIMLDQTATELVTTQLLRKRDISWSTAYFTTSVWTGGSGGVDLTGVAGAPAANQFRQWDQAGSTPIIDIRNQITSIARVTGYRPNTLVLGARVWTSLADHPDLLERIKYTERAIAGPDLLASLLDLKSVHVNWVIQNTANEGAASPTYDFALASGKSALLVYSNPAPAPRTVSGGYTFAWTGFLGANAYGARMKSFRMEWLESDRVEGEMAYSQKVIASDLGVYFNGCVA